MDFTVIKSELVEGQVISLVDNRHCEHYEVQIDNIPVFYSKDYPAAEHEYNMEML